MMNQTKAKKEWVLITGAGRGIGLAIAETLIAQGYHLVLNYRKAQGKSAANLQQLAARYPEQVKLIRADISEARDVAELAKNLHFQSVTQIDHLILNAASAPFKPLTQLDRNDWKLLLNTNLIGNINCIQSLLPFMHKGGTIVLLSSIGSQTALPNYPLGMIKSAIESMVQYLDTELYYRSIRVNAVCAGLVNTDMAPMLTEMWADILEKFTRREWRIMLEPEEVANIVEFLISNRSSAIRGATLLADLGFTYNP